MPWALNDSTLVKRSEQQVSCVLNGEIALLNLESAVYFGLSGTGAFIWSRLEAPRSVGSLCDDVTAEFDVAPQTCRDDVLKFLVRLHEAGLIEAAGE
jgi:hypothetical protein